MSAQVFIITFVCSCNSRWIRRLFLAFPAWSLVSDVRSKTPRPSSKHIWRLKCQCRLCALVIKKKKRKSHKPLDECTHTLLLLWQLVWLTMTNVSMLRLPPSHRGRKRSWDSVIWWRREEGCLDVWGSSLGLGVTECLDTCSPFNAKGLCYLQCCLWRCVHVHICIRLQANHPV